MLVRSHDDATDDETRWRAFVAQQGFGHLAAAGAGRRFPVVVPTQFVLDGDRVVLHLARPNPVFEAFAENPAALLSVAGDWAYIPGSWKAMGDEDPRAGLPTTYYGAVQLAGAVTVIDEPAAVAGVLRRQLGALEPGHDYIDPLDHGAKLRAIRGLVLQVEEVRAKFKYGGNVDVAHRQHVAGLLRHRAGPGDAAAVAQMRF